MPTDTGKDIKGSFYRWGNHGKKYYYTPGNKASMAAAKKKANAQGRAAHAAGYKGNDMLQRIKANFTGNIRLCFLNGKILKSLGACQNTTLWRLLKNV